MTVTRRPSPGAAAPPSPGHRTGRRRRPLLGRRGGRGRAAAV